MDWRDKLTKPFIPEKDEAYVETIQIDIPNKGIVDIKYEIPEKPTMQHEVDMWNDINSFETGAWNANNIGLKSGFDSIDRMFSGGLKPGFYVIAGDSHVGKTAICSQLATQIADLNNDAFVMDFSLDDPKRDKMCRVIACSNKVLCDAVKMPTQYTHMPLMLARRMTGINKLRQSVGKYKIYDSTFSTYIEDIEDEILRIKLEFESKGIEKQIVVIIDNLHDLNIKSKSSSSENEKYDTIAQWCSDTATKFDIPFICTAELRKQNGNLRPFVDEIRSAGKIKFEAKAIIMCYNEVHYKGEGASVHFMRAGQKQKQPILELHVAKNKIAGHKGRLYFEMYPEMARIEEADEQSSKHYASLAFGG